MNFDVKKHFPGKEGFGDTALSIPYMRAEIPYMQAEIARLQAEVGRLREEINDAKSYAIRLSISLWEKHYKEISPEWSPLDSLIGVMTQIDNMSCGLEDIHNDAIEKAASLFTHPEEEGIADRIRELKE